MIILHILLISLAVLLGVIVCLALFIFWIVMLVDAIKRKFDTSEEKIVWVLVIIFVQLIGAVIYYFVVKTKDKKSKRR